MAYASSGLQTRLRGQNGGAASIASHGSRTMVVTSGSEEQTPPREPSGTLYLRGDQPRNRARVQWSEDTVDNEHMNRKKSKVCCIFRKQRMFGESDSESDSDCGSCSDSDSPNEYERMPDYSRQSKARKGKGRHEHCSH
ncbi:hypothetical protein GQ54DRAFT_258449 [Martensiomyces pterosporus]|nr:hypothetical protein GQ54DRAFT_258449 [Martensiomyces pterosporus]